MFDRTAEARRAATRAREAGSAHVVAGRFDEAIRCYRQALTLSPGYARAAVNLAKVRRFTWLPTDPDFTLLRIAANRAPRDAQSRRDICYALGKAYDDTAEWDMAARHYREANEPRAEDAKRAAGELLDAMALNRYHFTAEWFASRPPDPTADPTPVFILGIPRSGTTLVEQVLAAHPAVHGGGESQEVIRLVQAVGEQSIDVADPRAARTLGRQYVEHARSLAPPEAVRVTDKLPGNLMYAGFIATILPGARFIWCRRDPMDTAVSLYFTDFESGHEYSNDMGAIGRVIRGATGLMEHWQHVLGERVMAVGYEDLVRDVEGVARLMVRHVGLPWNGACARPHEVTRPVRTASAYQVRQPVYRDSVGRSARYQGLLEPVRAELASPQLRPSP